MDPDRINRKQHTSSHPDGERYYYSQAFLVQINKVERTIETLIALYLVVLYIGTQDTPTSVQSPLKRNRNNHGHQAPRPTACRLHIFTTLLLKWCCLTSSLNCSLQANLIATFARVYFFLKSFLSPDLAWRFQS